MSDELTQIENASIHKFLHSVADEGYFSGRVLDYGCGRQPYRRLVEEHGGEYVGYDRVFLPANRAGDVGPDDPAWPRCWDAVLCTQVLQFVPLIVDFIGELHGYLKAGGCLVLTYTTNWPEVNVEDLHRHTKSGMECLLTDAGFSILRHDRRATIHAHGYEWAFGYGAVCRA